MFYYETNPVDFFGPMMPICEACRSIRHDTEDPDAEFGLFVTCMKAAHFFGLHGKWDGDIRGKNLYVFALPVDDGSLPEIGIVWKQDDNGTTYIASPVRLPWLDDGLLGEQ